MGLESKQKGIMAGDILLMVTGNKDLKMALRVGFNMIMCGEFQEFWIPSGISSHNNWKVLQKVQKFDYEIRL